MTLSPGRAAVVPLVVAACAAAVSPGPARSTPEDRGSPQRLEGVAGNGTADDADALQKLVDSASARAGAVVQLPPGAYRISKPIRLRSNVVVSGSGRHWGTQIRPVGCPAFVIDGTDAPGHWAFRIRLQDLTIDARKAEGTAVIEVRSAYNVDLVNLFVYSTGGTKIPALRLSGCNDIVVRDLVAYGANTSTQYGILLDGAAGPVTAKIYSPDVEAYHVAIQAQGEVNADIFAPYVERSTVAYTHAITAGRVAIYGGELASINGYPLSIQGDNLSVYGTDLDPRVGPKRGGWGLYTPNTVAYRNVRLYDVPRIAQPGFLPPNLNWLQFQSSVSPVPGQIRRTVDLLPHTLESGAEAKLVRLDYLDWAKCKLTLHGHAGDANVVEEFTFTIHRGTAFSSVAATPVLQEGGDEKITLKVNLAADKQGVTVAVRPRFGGHQPLTLYGDLEVVAVTPKLGAITLPEPPSDKEPLE